MIAVMISVYENSKVYEVKEALNSLYNQTINSDIFLAVDGPIDKELKEFLLSQPIKLYFLENNMGIPKAHNFLLKEILKKDYKYIARMDSDDISVDNRFELQYNFLEQNPDIDIVGGYIKEVYNNGDEKIVKYPLNHTEIFAFFKKRVPIANVTTFFRREFFDKVGFYPESSPTNEDTLLWLKAFKKKIKFANIPQILVIVRAKESYLKRRGGVKKAYSDFKDRIKVTKELGFGFEGYLYALLMFLVNVSPICIKKIIYKFR